MFLLKLQEFWLLFFFVTLVKTQSYDGDYDSEEHSSYNDGDSSDGPDYSRYFSGEPSSSIAQGGFVSPGEFSGFFGPSFFAASNKQEVTKHNPEIGFTKTPDFQSGFSELSNGSPFAGKDYFEDSDKKQNAENFEIKPGPSYVSHKVVPPNSKYTTEVDELLRPKTFGSGKKNSKLTPLPLYTASKQAIVDPKYVPQYTPKNPNNVTPYQKYGYHSIDNLDFKPTNQQPKYAQSQKPSNDFKPIKPPQKLARNCKKIYKTGPGLASADCYICKDIKGTNYEECSYSQESNPKNYYIESTKQYVQPEKIDSYRYKRYTVQDDKDDPYEYLKAQSEKYYNSPDFESTYKKPKGYGDYGFGSDFFNDGEEKSSSEQHSEQLVKSGESCEKVHRDDGMICTVCSNKKTGGNYEQCSYSTEPEEKRYAYVKERKYNSDDDDHDGVEDEEDTESSEEQPKRQKLQRESNSRDHDEVERIRPVNTHRRKSQYTVPRHFEQINAEPEKNQEADEDYDHDDYYFKYSPEESKQDEQQEAPEGYGYYGDAGQKDVEEVLAEFAKKDRSKCKKSQKNGMTCYLCTDKKGLQHEECMYVSESRPQSKYQSYHAQKETEGKEPRSEETRVKSVRKIYKVTEPHVSESQYGATNKKYRTKSKRQNYNPYNKRKRNYRRAKSVPKTSRNDDKDDKYKVDGEGPEGAFSHETEPIYSNEYGTTLPRFMLIKSEGEKIYDELSRGHH